jgi:hypothetical protein
MGMKRKMRMRMRMRMKRKRKRMGIRDCPDKKWPCSL